MRQILRQPQEVVDVAVDVVVAATGARESEPGQVGHRCWAAGLRKPKHSSPSPRSGERDLVESAQGTERLQAFLPLAPRSGERVGERGG
jgi:hypothetical protein